MRTTLKMLLLVAAVSVAVTGCAGPEKKLGRGMVNATEIVRGGEFRRSMEQTALWYGPETAYSTGAIRGFSRTMGRTFLGFYEILTFPIPSYEPVLTRTFSAGPVYPDNYRPALLEDSMFSPDTSLGFAGGDVAPMIPGSRFRIFDN